jgi:two-component system, OmpR family, sensor histidine kinase KdpD
VLGHELRRPLTVIRGASTLLIDDADALPPGSRQQMLSMIDRSSAEMSDLIDDVLMAVHLDIGDVQFSLEPVDVRGLVEDAVGAIRLEEPARGVEIGPTDGLAVEADREHALRALRALVENADRHSPAGDTVTVTADAEDDVVRLLVLDRGPGIPAAERERAFERFTRLDPNASGAGLGLFLARGLARGMGGEVSLADREDGGTAACFTLRRRG